MNGLRTFGWVGTVAVSALLFLTSLPLVAFACEGGRTVEGWLVLIWGWWGLLMMNPAWLANPVYAGAFVTSVFRVHAAGAALGAAAVVLGLFSLAADEWYFNEGSGTPIVRFGPAYYVWMASFGVMAAGNAWLAAARSRAKGSA